MEFSVCGNKKPSGTLSWPAMTRNSVQQLVGKGASNLIKPYHRFSSLSLLETHRPVLQRCKSLLIVIVPRVRHECVYLAKRGDERMRWQALIAPPRRLLAGKLEIIHGQMSKADPTKMALREAAAGDFKRSTGTVWGCSPTAPGRRQWLSPASSRRSSARWMPHFAPRLYGPSS